MTLCKFLHHSDALCIVALVAAAAISPALQSQKPAQEPSKPVEAAAPKITAEHAQLKKMIGSWDATVTHSMPGQPAKTSSAKAEYRAVGETWIASTFTGEMNGKPFVGHGIDGFDTLKNKYVTVWVDSATTEVHQYEGTGAGNTTTLTGECHDPATGDPVRQRIVNEFKDNDTMTMRMFTTGPEGKEVEGMKIEFKRKK